MNLKRWIPPIPREHGAWVMWILPWCMGVAVERRITNLAVALWLVCAGLFCLRSSLVVLVKRWHRGPVERRHLATPILEYLFLTGLFALPFYPHLNQLRLLLPAAALFFLVDVFLVSRRWDKSFAYEAVGIATLTFSGPATVYVSSLPALFRPAVGGPPAQVPQTMLTLWLMVFFYFVGTIFHVRILKTVILRRETTWDLKSKAAAGLPSLTYLLLTILGLLVGGSMGWLPRELWVVLVPSLAKSVDFLTRLIHVPVNLRRSGKWEIAHAVVFGLLGIWAMGS